MFSSEDRLMVICAHPDDEVLGCGGLIAKIRTLGGTVRVLFLGEGVSARFPDSIPSDPRIAEANKLRETEATDALTSLGVDDVHFGDFLSCRFDTLPLINLVRIVESHLDTFRPTIVVTHNPSETNVDHKITYQATEVACRPRAEAPHKTILGMEIVCSGNFVFEKNFSPSFYVNIADEWQSKAEAWACYANEERNFPFPRCAKGLKTQARYRGMQAGLELAEAFSLLRGVY